MEAVIFIILSAFFVCLGIMTQIKIFKKHHPNAELLTEFLHKLCIQQDTSAIGNKNYEKN